MGLLGMNQYQILCLVYICFGATFYGYDSGITSAVLAYEDFLVYFKLNNVTIGAFNLAYYSACAIGTMANFYLGNKIGRLRSIQLASVISICGIVLQTAAQNFTMFVIGRVVGGIACGIMFAICPVYASEISPPTIRGRVGAFYSINISFSYMITEWLGLAFYFLPDNTSWRVLFGLQFLPGLAMLNGSFWMPFSPRWLVYVGRYDEAKVVLKRIHSGIEHNEHYADIEFHQIRAQIEADKVEKLGVKDIFRKKSYMRRIALVAGFFFAQQCTGVVPISNYQDFIYQSMNFSPVLSLVLLGMWGTTSTISVLTTGFWFDKLGRRNGLFLAYGIMIPAIAILVGCWSSFEKTGSTDRGLSTGALVGIYLFCFGFSGVMNSFGPTYGSEIMPTNIRATGVAVGYFVFNALIILHVQTAPQALAALSWKYFAIFLVLDCIYVVIVYFCYPETKNKTLEEIEGVFGDRLASSWEEATKKASLSQESTEEKGVHASQVEKV